MHKSNHRTIFDILENLEDLTEYLQMERDRSTRQQPKVHIHENASSTGLSAGVNIVRVKIARECYKGIKVLTLRSRPILCGVWCEIPLVEFVLVAAYEHQVRVLVEGTRLVRSNCWYRLGARYKLNSLDMLVCVIFIGIFDSILRQSSPAFEE